MAFLQLVFGLLFVILALVVGLRNYLLNRPYTRNERSISKPPKAGGSWPIIGHMHLFGSQQLMHKKLGDMADKYGPIFTIRLGSHEVLVLSNWVKVKECFTAHDKIFSTRPTIAASKLLGYDSAMFGFAPYGTYWREMRKVATIELLSDHRLDRLKQIRASEIETAVKEMYNTWSSQGCPENGVMVEMKQWFGDLTQNIISRMVVGKRYLGFGAQFEENDARRSYRRLLRDFAFLFGAVVLSDAIPWLGWLDLNGYEKAMKITAKELDSLIQGWLVEHRLRSDGNHSKQEKDFMDVMINIMQDDHIHEFDADTVIKATCLNLILAGSDTTLVTLTWALSLLLNNPQVMRKVQDELDIHVGKARQVEESDIRNLIYLQAVVKETLRLYPPEPIIGLRAAQEDCTFSSGYVIPSGTQLMVNAWKIQRDGRVWPQPDSFQPERFLTSHKDIDVKGQNFELIPFGSGRRSCPGISLALKVVHLTLARLLDAFSVSTPSGGVVDMTESNGLTNLKATPLEVLLTPRKNCNFYKE